MPFGLPFTRRFSIVDDGYKPVPVVPDIKDHVAIHKIGMLEHAAYFLKIVPTNCLDDADPRFDFVCGIWIVFDRLAQILTRNDMHMARILHKM